MTYKKSERKMKGMKREADYPAKCLFLFLEVGFTSSCVTLLHAAYSFSLNRTTQPTFDRLGNKGKFIYAILFSTSKLCRSSGLEL